MDVIEFIVFWILKIYKYRCRMVSQNRHVFIQKPVRGGQRVRFFAMNSAFTFKIAHIDFINSS